MKKLRNIKREKHYLIVSDFEKKELALEFILKYSFKNTRFKEEKNRVIFFVEELTTIEAEELIENGFRVFYLNKNLNFIPYGYEERKKYPQFSIVEDNKKFEILNTNDFSPINSLLEEKAKELNIKKVKVSKRIPIIIEIKDTEKHPPETIFFVDAKKYFDIVELFYNKIECEENSLKNVFVTYLKEKSMFIVEIKERELPEYEIIKSMAEVSFYPLYENYLYVQSGKKIVPLLRKKILKKNLPDEKIHFVLLKENYFVVEEVEKNIEKQSIYEIKEFFFSFFEKEIEEFLKD